MALTLWTLLEASILFLNAICILHEERFLAKMGWWKSPSVQGFGEPPSLKAQFLNLMHSIRTVTRIRGCKEYCLDLLQNPFGVQHSPKSSEIRKPFPRDWLEIPSTTNIHQYCRNCV